MTCSQNITALIYDKRGRVLSVGKNSYIKTHPLQAKHAKAVGEEHKIYMHAEINALIKLRYNDKAHKIVITRFGHYGQTLIAKPCKICERALRMAGITNIEHTVTEAT